MRCHLEDEMSLYNDYVTSMLPLILPTEICVGRCTDSRTNPYQTKPHQLFSIREKIPLFRMIILMVNIGLTTYYIYVFLLYIVFNVLMFTYKIIVYLIVNLMKKCAVFLIYCEHWSTVMSWLECNKKFM